MVTTLICSAAVPAASSGPARCRRYRSPSLFYAILSRHEEPSLSTAVLMGSHPSVTPRSCRNPLSSLRRSMKSNTKADSVRACPENAFISPHAVVNYTMSFCVCTRSRRHWPQETGVLLGTTIGS
jgi:hypothetical protein